MSAVKSLYVLGLSGSLLRKQKEFFTSWNSMASTYFLKPWINITGKVRAFQSCRDSGWFSDWGLKRDKLQCSYLEVKPERLATPLIPISSDVSTGWMNSVKPYQQCAWHAERRQQTWVNLAVSCKGWYSAPVTLFPEIQKSGKEKP